VLLAMEGWTIALPDLDTKLTSVPSIVGYKFKFHGEDAKIASRELGIAW